MSGLLLSARRTRLVIVPALVLVLAAVALLIRPDGPAARPPPGSDVTLGATDPSTVVGVDFILRQPGRAAIDAFLTALNQPGSGQYHRYLTPAQFGARFGLGDAAITRARSALQAAGLQVSSVEPQRTLLHARATVAALERLLGVVMQDRQTADGTRFHAPTGEPRIPPSLRDAITGVDGLSDRPNVFPLFRLPAFADVRSGGMLPEDVRRAYDLQGLTDAGMDGTGQTVAILSFDSFIESDVAAWESVTGVHGPPVEKVAFAGPVQPGAGSDEVNLDIDTIRSVAPQAKILDFEMNRKGGNFAAMMSAVLNDGRADIVSISWGHCEAQASAASRAAADAEFQAANAAGISIYVASGDQGAYDCNGAQAEGDLTVSVDYPSASPYVISVGGTTLWVRQDGTYASEDAWADPLRGSGTGGGESAVYPRPSWQQANGIDSSTTNRLVPDVAGPADASTGLLIAYTPPGATQPIQTQGGGTSQAAPFWAGTTALIRQFADAEGVLPTVNGHKRIGALAQPLYELAASAPNGPVFHDITLGSNLRDDARTGWDPATGLGTPIGVSLAQALATRFQTGTR
jgi:subtilase family serine protease